MSIRASVKGTRLRTSGLRMAQPLRTGSQEPSPFVPPGYTLAWHDEFVTYNVVNPTLTTPTIGEIKWIPYFYGWAVRTLGSNSDDGQKIADYEVPALPGGGSNTLNHTQLFDADGTYIATKTYGRYLHDISPQDTMIMRAYKTPPTYAALAYNDNPFWGYPYQASMISTENSYVQGYGYFEIRFRVVKFFAGVHFSIWLLSKSLEWPPEIDVLEILGHQPDRWYNGVHGDPNGGLGASLISSDGVTVDAGSGLVWATVPTYGEWHTLGFRRTATTLTWSLDGVEIRVNSNYLTPANLPMFFLLTYEIAGTWEGEPSPSAPWPAEFEVEYVRIYV